LGLSFIKDPAAQARRDAKNQRDILFTAERLPERLEISLILRRRKMATADQYCVMIEKKPAGSNGLP